MFRRQRTGRTRLVAAAMLLGLVGGSLLVAGPAQAASSVTDGFEGNPYDRWQTEEQMGDSLVWLGNHLQRRTGTNAAWLDAPFEVPARIYRSVVVDRPSPSAVVCYAEAWVKKAPETAGTPRLRMGIRSPGVSPGVYIALTTYDLTNTSYGRAQFATFDYQTPNLIIDISATRGQAYVDDVTVWCARRIS